MRFSGLLVVDLCICHAKIYGEILKQHCTERVIM
jgi:hypothetical protein